MNIWFLEIIVNDRDISFIRSKFCYKFWTDNEESIILKEDFSNEPFMKDYIDKFIYKFLYYFKDMDCIVWLDIDEWIKILLDRIEKCSNNERFPFVFHHSFKIIDLKYHENHSVFFNSLKDYSEYLEEYPYLITFVDKSDILSSCFKDFWWILTAKIYNDTLFSWKWTILINPEKILIPEKEKINNHFTLMKYGCKGEWRIKDLAQWNDSWFILKKWSIWNRHASYKKDRTLRDAFERHWKIEYSAYFMYVKDDIQFKSPKLAADFLFWNWKWENDFWLDDSQESINVYDYSIYTDNFQGTTDTETWTIPDLNVSNDDEDILYLKKWIVDAKWKYDTAWVKFIILKWSRWDKRLTNSFKVTNSLMSKYIELSRSNKFSFDKNNTVLNEDIIFNSANQASCFIQWNCSWKATDWGKLNSIEKELLEWDDEGIADIVESEIDIEEIKKLVEESESITDEQAKNIVRSWLDKLNFKNLKTITIWVVDELVKFKWKNLWFPSLSSLKNWQAYLFWTKYKWLELDLSWLKEINDECSEYLSYYDWDVLDLSWLSDLTSKQIDNLAQCKCKKLILTWIREIKQEDFDKLFARENGFVYSIYLRYTQELKKPDIIDSKDEGFVPTEIDVDVLSDEDEKSEEVADANTDTSDGIDEPKVVGTKATNGVLDNYEITLSHATLDEIYELKKVKARRMQITISYQYPLIKEIFFKEVSRFNCEELSIRWIPYEELSSSIAHDLSEFKWKVLEVWINGWTFRFDALRELIKFRWDYLIISWFNKLEETQDWILIKFEWDHLGVHWKLTKEQKEFFNWYEWITYSEIEKKALDDEKEYTDVDELEWDWWYDEDEHYDFSTMTVINQHKDWDYYTISWHHITNEDAEKYSRYNCRILELDVRRINNEQVRVISLNFNWDMLIISWIKSISDEQARWLSHFRWDKLSLPDIDELSEKQIAYLKHFKWSEIDIPWFEEEFWD